jgi:uncharacterized membrane protein YesL
MKKLPFFATIGNTLKKTFIEVYSSMGLSILISFTWCVSFLPILFTIYGLWGGLATAHGLSAGGDRLAFFLLGAIFIAFWNGLITGPLTTAWYGIYQVRKSDYASFKKFLEIFKKNYWRSAGIHWLYSLLIVMLLFNIIIAFRNSNLLLIIAGVLSGYMLFLFSLTSFYFHPLIYLDNGFKKVVKKSFLLTMDNMGLTLFFSVFMGLMFLISIGMVFPLLLIYGAVAIYVIDYGFEPIYQKYDE